MPQQQDSTQNNSTHQQDLPSASDQLEALEAELAAAKDQAQRALADYQNLVRRTQEDRIKMIKLASREFVESLLQPLDHLTLAARQLDDQGLNMVVSQLWQALESQGLHKIEALGQPFDVNRMEVIDKTGDGDVVTKVQSDGYELNGELIRHAKVVVGSEKTTK